MRMFGLSRFTLAREFLHLVISFLFLVVVAWFLWGYRDAMLYAFQSAHAPIEYGNVAQADLNQLQHNTYVQLSGITEHRGLKQTLVRNFQFPRQEFWYFRLLGSRGVFIEVPPEPEHYSTTMQLTVEGRVVDLNQAPIYHYLLDTYDQLYHTERKPVLRLIQVGVKPGNGRLSFVCALIVLTLLLFVNMITIMRWMKSRSDRGDVP